MTQIHTRRQSTNPFIETIWSTQNVTDGTYLATPDGSWDLIVFIDQDGHREMMLAGQATKPTDVPYQAGTAGMVISFVPGAYLDKYDLPALVDTWEMLPKADDEHFVLAGHAFAFPTFDTAEILVNKMVEVGLLKKDDIIEEVLRGTPPAMSERAKQRHFMQTTGMTRKAFDQIKRAQHAVALLQQGKKPVDAAADAGYTDQAHLTKSLKRIMHSSPKAVDDINKV